jgi:hypothetical protein
MQVLARLANRCSRRAGRTFGRVHERVRRRHDQQVRHCLAAQPRQYRGHATAVSSATFRSRRIPGTSLGRRASFRHAGRPLLSHSTAVSQQVTWGA